MLIDNDESSPFAFARRAALHWRLGAWVFAGVFLLTAAITVLLPNCYQAHLKILVKNERADPLVGADRQTQGVIYLNEVSEARVNTEIQLLTSADVLRKVVEKRRLADFVGMRRQPQPSRDERALARLEKDLTVSAIRNSNVIEATYESKDPQRASEVLRTLAEEYMTSHRTLHGAHGSYAFFGQLAARASAELVKAQSELADFQRVHSIVALPQQKTLALENIAHLKARMEESAAESRKSGVVAEQLSKTMATLPPKVERGRRTMPNQVSVEQLGMLLLTLENKRAEAVLRYQPADRVIKELNAQIEQTQAALDQATHSGIEEVSMGANPALDGAEVQYIQSTAGRAGNDAEAKELGRQIIANKAELAALDAQSVTYQSLVRKVNTLEEVFDGYQKKAEDAQVGEMLDGERISNVAVMEEPFTPTLPAFPKRGLLLSLGFVWSLMLAGAAVIAREVMVERINSPFALEQSVGMPLLASVPAVAGALHSSESFPALYLAMQRQAAPHDRRVS